MSEPLETIEREVWATPDEFRHGLELGFPGRVTGSEGNLRADDGQAGMAIALEVLAPRRIALLNLPRMKVSIHMTAGTPEQRQAMLARMDLAMQRGGG
jgi:hypothetical protein